MGELRLMKGNEVLAEAAIRAGVDGYFGYPITPQSEVMETLMLRKPWEETGMVVLQAESEVASINMVYGGAACGKKVMTSSSSPGYSLMQEGISYLAGAELPCVIINVSRGGPGLGTIQPSQADYFQVTKGGGHGDYHVIALAPNSVQEMSDFMTLAFDLAFKYRCPAVILSDGAIGQMMEKVYLSDFVPRRTEEQIRKDCGEWCTLGSKRHNVITSLELDSVVMEQRNIALMKKYAEMQKEARYEAYMTDDADYLFVAFGTASRICKKSIEMAREKGIKAGLFRPITLYPFPTKALYEIGTKMKGILSVEMNAGQMVEDVKLAVECKVPVEWAGRNGGIIPSPDEVLEALETKIIGGK
ncbi:MAG: 3-methyl-2-oxobutanoate dehydrogenase subunit VorB [Bacteroidales bacterium]|nr:3-methyl-2-oxobutanoate dehydrogenase subunit VorB [Bacteroidales bacterium]